MKKQETKYTGLKSISIIKPPASFCFGLPFARCILSGMAFAFLMIASASAQTNKLVDLEFDEPPRLDFENGAGILYFIEGDFHILSFDAWNGQPSAIYNRSTGTVNYTEYFIRRQFDFGEETIYLGQRRTGNFHPNQFLRLNPNGTFSNLPTLPVWPEVFHNGKGYGKNNTGIYEISLNPVSSRLLSAGTGNWAQSGVQLNLHGDSLYITRGSEFLIYSIPHDTITFAHQEYLAHHNLHLIPFSGMEGRFLYEKISEHGPTEIHELGGHQFAREIPSANELPPSLIWRSNVTNGWNYTWFGPNSIHSQGNMTRMVTFNHALPDNMIHYNNGIIEVNRSLDNPSAKMTRRFLRAATESGDASFVIQGLDEGEKFVALGIFGPEGAEPYGVVNDSLQALNDLLPGALGSVDYFLRQSTLNSTRTQKVMVHDHKVWFLASAPGIGLAPAVSDGTKAGSFIVDDLFPGTQGILSGAYAAHDGELYLLAQHEDLSIALYHMGEVHQPLPHAEPERVDWENVFGALPDTWHVGNYNQKAQSPKVAVSDEGSIFYLSTRGYLGHLIGDEPGVFSFDGQPHPYDFGSSHIQRLHKLDAQTGELQWMRSFMATYLSAPGPAELAVNEKGEALILGIGQNIFQSFGLDTSVAETSGAQSSRLSLKTFDTEGNLTRISHLNTYDSFSDIYYLNYEGNGNYLAAVRKSTSPGGVLWIRFNAEGYILQSLQTHIPVSQRINVRLYDGKYWVSKTEDRNVCTDCTAEFWVYDAHKLRQEHYSSLTYNGRLWNPSLHITSNGEWWYTGAINGSFKHGYMSDPFVSSASQNYTSNIFLLRLIPQLSRVVEVKVLREEVISFYAPDVIEDNIFLSYTAVNLEQERSPFEGISTSLDSGFANDVPLETGQIDGVGQLINIHRESVKLCDARKPTAYTQVYLPDGKWFRAFAAEEANCGHVDWHLPLPLYQRRYGTRIQMTKMSWPFEPLELPAIAAVEDDDNQFMQIFPNPVSNGYFYITPNGGNQIPYNRFHIHDMQGRIVHESTIPDFFNYHQVFLPQSLHAGVYQVVFTGGSARESHRLVMIK